MKRSTAVAGVLASIVLSMTFLNGCGSKTSDMKGEQQETVISETEETGLTEAEQAVLVAYQKVKEELLNPHSMEVYECYAKKAGNSYLVRIDYSATSKIGARNEHQGFFRIKSHDDKKKSYVEMTAAGAINGLSAQFPEFEEEYERSSADEVVVDPERIIAHEKDSVYIEF